MYVQSSENDFFDFCYWLKSDENVAFPLGYVTTNGFE